MRRRIGLAFLALSLAVAPAHGGTLKHEDPIEQRIKTISLGLRCPVCQGESIYDSHSNVARQMKALIHEQVALGKSDDEILTFFAERYGEFVLMQPRANLRNAGVWAFPALAFLGGIAGFLILLRRRAATVSSGGKTVTGAATADLINRIERLGP